MSLDRILMAVALLMLAAGAVAVVYAIAKWRDAENELNTLQLQIEYERSVWLQGELKRAERAIAVEKSVELMPSVELVERLRESGWLSSPVAGAMHGMETDPGSAQGRGTNTPASAPQQLGKAGLVR